MVHDIRELSRKWFDRAWNQRDDSVMAEMISPDALIHGLAEDGQKLRGWSQFAQFRTAFLTAFDDLRLEIEDVLVENDKSAVRLSFTATHNGDGLPLAPTGRSFRSTAIVILRWRGDKIVEAWNEFDAAGMMRQLTTPTTPTTTTLRVASVVEA